MDFQQKARAVQPLLHRLLARLVAIPSIRGGSEVGAPYGQEPKRALLEALQIARELGFKTVNLDNQVGYAQYGADVPSGAYIGIFGHVDVMPLGEGWQTLPWQLTEVQGRLYGRGTLDNKGPILANLIALYLLKEAGIHFPIPVRIVFGTNEETGFGCIRHYLACEQPPIFGWTPDCKWPVVYGERGRLRLRVTSFDAASLYQFANRYLLQTQHNGVELGIACRDEDFGALIMRGYQLSMVNQYHAIEWAISYPTCCTPASLVAKIESHLSPYLNLEVISNWDPVLYDKQSVYVQALQQAYQQVTGDIGEPVTTTGGTYAKLVPNIVAYGPSFPGQRDIAHLPNEWIGVDDLVIDTEIYCRALVAVMSYYDETLGKEERLCPKQS